MDDPEADMKLEAEEDEEGGVRYQDPLLVPTPILLARREVPTRYPRATIMQLHRVTEETLIYRKHEQLSCQLPGAPKSTFLMVFSPDGSKVASTHGDHNIYVSEVKTGHCICKLEGHPRTPWCVAFHPASNEIIASGCLGGEVRVWDLKGGSEVWTTEKNTVIASLAFHPTDQVLVIATFNEIYFWDWFQPEPFAKISTSDEKEKVRYVKFDPLGHKLITGIANTAHDRTSFGSVRAAGSTAGSNLSRSELMEREQQLSHRYNQLSSQYLSLVSRYEALTSRAFNSVSRSTSRIDRGTDPIEPPPATPRQQALLNQARQFARQVTEERRGPCQNQESSNQGEGSRSRPSWPSSDAQGSRDSQATGDINLRLEEDYGLSAVRTLRQIISDDSASSSSLDSSSSATSGTSGVSERNTRLSLLWTSRLHRPGQDSDSAGEASSVHSSGEAGAIGPGDHRSSLGSEEAVTSTRRSENNTSDRRSYQGPEDRASDDEQSVGNMGQNWHSPWSQSERRGTQWGYYSSEGPSVQGGRSRASRESRSESAIRTLQNSEADPLGPSEIELEVIQNSGLERTIVNNDVRSEEVESTTTSSRNPLLTRDDISSRTSDSTSELQNNQRDFLRLSSLTPNPRSDPNEDLAVPGPSGFSAVSRPQTSSHTSTTSRYPTSSTLDPQFGVQLLSRHIENMQRICRAHLEITRHRHEILRLQQIRSMLYDIQHQIHSLRVSVDQSMEDLRAPSGGSSYSSSQRSRGTGGDDDPQLPSSAGSSYPSLSMIRNWCRTRSVARLQRGPFGTRTRSRHSHRSWMMSPGLFRRLPRRRSVRTRLLLPGIPAPTHGSSSSSGGAVGGRSSPARDLGEPGSPTTSSGTGAVIGPLPTPPPDQGDSEEQPRDIVRIVSGNQYGTQTRTMLRRSFERLQERLRERQEALEQQQRRLHGTLNTPPSSPASASRYPDHPPTPPPERYRRAGPPTTSLASRIANMLAHQSEISNGISGNSGTDNAATGNSEPAADSSSSSARDNDRYLYMYWPSERPYERPVDRTPYRPSNRNLDRLHSYDRFPDRTSETNGDSLPVRTPGRFTGRNTGRLMERNDRNSDRLSDSLNPLLGLPRPPRPQAPGPPPSAPPSLRHLDDSSSSLPQLDDAEPQVNDFNNNSSQWLNERRRLRQAIMNARREMLVGHTSCNNGGSARFPMLALRSRNANNERTLLREGIRRERRDRYRQILQRMADRLNSLVNQEVEQQEQQQQQQQQQPQQQQRQQEQVAPSAPSASSTSEADPDASSSSMDNHMLNLRLLVRLALHLIYQLLNFICNQNISYEERPISRLPNPFRDEELGNGGEGQRADLPPPMGLDLEPGLHNLTTLLETVRMASEELRNDDVGDADSNLAQESTRPITNVPRRLTDFLRRSGNMANQQDGGSTSGRNSLSNRGSSPRPQLVIPRITLSDPSGSESQVEEENASSAPEPGPSYNDQAEFSTRSVSGVPLRLLGRQYAIDLRSPDSEDSPGPPPEGAQEEPLNPPDPPFPWRSHLSPYDVGLPRGPAADVLFRPNLRRVPPDRAAEREADNFFSRPYFTPHFGAPRSISASLVTHRIQAWDFTHYNIPDISDSGANIVVEKCKIHNDASVDISADGTLLAALVPESQAMTMVGVYSLEDRSLGQLLYSYIFAPNTICVSLSPVARHLVVGFASHMPRLVPQHNTKQVVAQIYKLCDNPMFHGRGQAGHLQFLKDIEVMTDNRHTSLNCIRWLPYPGQGLIYGTNRGQLNILR